MTTINITLTREDLNDIISERMPIHRKSFLSLARSLRNSITNLNLKTTEKKITLITEQYFEFAHTELYIDGLELAADSVFDQINAQKMTSYQRNLGRWLRLFEVKLEIDTENKEILKFIEVESGAQITQYFTNNFIANVKDALKLNLPDQEVLNIIRQTVSLDRPQVARSFKFLQSLMKDGISGKQLQTKFTKFNSRLLDIRAERIGRTEIARIENFGRIEAAKEAEAAKVMKNTKQTWHAVIDGRNWPSSLQNNGKTVKLGQPFPSGDNYPNEINDRCVITMKGILV